MIYINLKKKNIKRYITVFVFCLLFIGCSKNESSYITFSGEIKNSTDEIITISNYNSTMKEDFPIDSSGHFSARVNIDKDGYYFFKIGRPYSIIRFKKGHNVHLDIDADNFFESRIYSGDLKVENNYGVSKSKLRSKFVGDPKDYFVVPLDEFLLKIKKTRDAVFELLEKSELSQEDKLIEKRIIEYDYLQSYNNYQKFYSYHKKVKANLPDDYYEPIINMDIDDGEIFKYSRAYRNLIIENFRHSSKKEMDRDSALTIIEFVKNKISNIKSVDIREQYASMLMRQMKEGNDNIDDDYHQIMPLFSTQRMKDKLTQRYQSAKETTSGNIAVDFDYENFNGGRTTLRDLSGKLIYIDVWATWCGPCIKEMPALKELVNFYKGKDIEFVSISIDHKKDYEKWRKMVPEKNVGGIQLYDAEGLKSSFMKAFSVGLIPRFMMIDEQGKIISANAPRPSDKNVKDFIDRQLNRPKAMRFTSK